LPSNSDPVLIVGGGLGGLTTALALARRGFESRVLEGAPEFGAIGYGIQFGPNVFHVFDRIGVTDAVMAKGDVPPAVVMRDGYTGEELVRIPTGDSFRARRAASSIWARGSLILPSREVASPPRRHIIVVASSVRKDQNRSQAKNASGSASELSGYSILIRTPVSPFKRRLR
jgi:hypothetical protein